MKRFEILPCLGERGERVGSRPAWEKQPDCVAAKREDRNVPFPELFVDHHFRRTKISIKLNAGLATAALSVLLTACNPAGQADKTATADSGSAAEHSAPAVQPMAGPETPYSASEQQMHQAMMQAHGADPQETYALKMIEHHRGAIAMSEVLMRENPDAALREMAEKTITMQRQEITALEQWVAQHRSAAATPASGSVQPGA